MYGLCDTNSLQLELCLFVVNYQIVNQISR